MRNHLLAGTAMTAVERSQGRYMRAPDGHESGGIPGGGTETPPANNGGGNPGDSSASGGEPQNNSGQEFDATTFWQEPSEPKDTGKPSGQSPESQSDDPAKALGTRLATAINTMNFDPVFDDEIADQISKGDLKGANERMANVSREAVRQSLVLNAQMMTQFGSNVLAKVTEMIEARFGEQGNEETLLEAFPSARDPAVRPMIEGVFKQALKHTKGNREAAKALAKDMLKLVGKNASADFGIEVPPHNPGDYTQGSSTLVEELLARN